MPTSPDHRAAPAVMHDILHPSAATPAPPAAIKDIFPADKEIAAAAPVKSSLTLPASPAHAAVAPAAGLTLPQHRFLNISRDDAVWMTAGSLLAVLVMTSIATLARLGVAL